MADQVYPLGLQAFASKQIDWINDNFKWILVTAGYTFSTAHQYISDIGAGNIVARSPNLSSKTDTNGMLNAATVTVTSVSGSTVTQLILAQDTGVDSASRLICKVDSYTGLPFSPSGGNVPVVPPASGIMNL